MSKKGTVGGSKRVGQFCGPKSGLGWVWAVDFRFGN